ncbi:MAG: GIY-YIG nuclease family protein [Gammaproteobacteria bacterium]|jgi:putative endonuclease
MNKVFYIYFLTNWNNQILYIGVTNNLQRRLFEHRKGIVEGFTKKYNLKKLVYFEQTDDVYSAISREKQLKKWRREKKNNLVESLNPDWCDLAEDFSFYSK